MHRALTSFLLAAALTSGCAKEAAIKDIPTGSDVRIEKRDGVAVTGRLVQVDPERIVIDAGQGATTIRRADIAKVAVNERAAAGPVREEPRQVVSTTGTATPGDRDVREGAAAAGPKTDTPGLGERLKRAVSAEPEFREVTVPAGTVLPLTLRSTVGSATSTVEDAVRADLRAPVTINGVQAIPAGADVAGSVTAARRSAKVKGRGSVAFRFHTLEARGERHTISTAAISRVARATKKKDAAKIGIPAAGGAIIGAIADGKKGAAIGGAIGGGAGTAVVLSTRGEEVTFPAGSHVSVRLLRPITVRVPLK